MRKMRREPSTEREQLTMEQYVGTRPTSKLTRPAVSGWEEQLYDLGHPCPDDSVEGWIANGGTVVDMAATSWSFKTGDMLTSAGMEWTYVGVSAVDAWA